MCRRHQNGSTYQPLGKVNQSHQPAGSGSHNLETLPQTSGLILPVVISHPKKQRVLHWLPNFHIPMDFQIFTAAVFFSHAVHHPLFLHRWKTSRTRSWRLEDKDRRLALNGLWGELPKLVPQGIKLQQQGTKLPQHRLG